MRDVFKTLLETFDPTETNSQADDHKPMSFWMSLDTKAQYEGLQSSTKKKFGRDLKQSIQDAIKEAWEKAGCPKAKTEGHD